MKFSDIKKSVITQFAVPGGNRVVPMLMGKPGGGKSSVAREIAQALAEQHGIPAERIVEFNPSLREPSDILGLPDLSGECSRWVPPAELYALRHGVGPCILIIEELSDAAMDMQNPMCRVILDRYAGQMRLSDELYIIATGNRTEDRSGATRLSTKLANRMRLINFDEDLDDWCAWANAHDIDPMLVAFIRFRPELLSNFDPSKQANPTPRSWEDVSRIPATLEPSIYMEHCAGSVGEGAAAEYVGFRKIFDDLPDLRKVLKDPDAAEVPSTPAVKYATVAKLVSMATKTNFGSMAKYVAKFPAEFNVTLMRDAASKYSWVTSTPAFQAFCLKNVSLFTA